ncbi:hypothetical protein PsorP6_012379 [Peronosclerospora sorghi]|uniref:Uncharacterized protein n=1 Tax=Peronosclerospora sorghi TaxID=230839 RepID=A0ACC0WKA7_9STRA|nr:hypothetical protein PsorP6_012379 [Peronosclerospora sorghi]
MGEATAVMPPPVPLVSSPPATSLASSPATTSTGTRSGRKLREKVVNEIKNVRGRKSPRHRDKVSYLRATPPPPLELSEDGDDDDDEAVHAVGKAKGCSICERSFTVFRAKHTCKLCAQKICDDCSKNRMKLHRRLERKKGSRLCDPCARNYMHTENGSGEDATGASPDTIGPSPDTTSGGTEATLTRNARDGAKNPPGHSSVPAVKSLMHAQGKTSGSGSNATRKGETKVPKSKTRTPQVEECVHTSHLRMRHWLSLLVVALLVTLRVIYFNRRSSVERSADVMDSVDQELAEPPYSFLERALDSLLSMRTLGTYLLGLVVFDEISRLQHGKKGMKSWTPRARRRRRVSRSNGQRRRTHSSVSDTSKPDATGSSAPSSPHASLDDDLEVSVMEQNNDNESCTVDMLSVALEQGQANRAPDGKLSLACFVASCSVICGFLDVFGRATSFAGSTVGAYFTSIDQNIEAWPEPPSSSTWKEQSVKAVIQHEVELGVADVGGKKKPSCSRCLLRLLWFIQFVEACIRLTLLDSTDDNCYNGASKAYEETLGKRHPWLVRKGVNTALGSIPTRSHILSKLHVGEGDAIDPLRKVQVELVRIIAELQLVFEEHKLTDLK